MRRTIFASSAVALLLAVFAAAPAHAQATRTWVSGVGDDANPCSRTAPCKTFAGAISKTAAAGEINCIDPGGFGGVTITKSITIDCSNTEAGVLVSGTNGIIINAAATDIVVLRGLDIYGINVPSASLNGVRFLAGKTLHVEKCTIRNFRGASPNGNGILFAPSSGTSELYVTNTTVSGNGDIALNSGVGISVTPTGSGSAVGVISNVRAENNRQGIRADTSTTTGTITLTVRDSTASGSDQGGVAAASKIVGATTTAIMMYNVSSVNNGSGIIANGNTAIVRVGSSVLTGNTDAVTISNSGTVLSYKNNQIDGNTNNNTPIPQVNLN